MIFLRQRLEVHSGDGIAADVAPAACLNAALIDGKLRIGQDQIRRHGHPEAQTAALRTGAHGIVEGKQPRRKLRHGNAAFVAGIVAGKERLLAAVGAGDEHKTVRVRKRRLHAVGQAARDVAAQHEPVDHQLDAVLFVAVEHDGLAQVVEIPVHAHAGKAAAPRVVKYLAVLALLAAHDRREHQKARALRHGQHLVDDLVDALAADLSAAFRAVRHARARPEQAQMVVDLRHRAHGRARVAGGRLLVNGDRGGKPLDQIHIRLVQLAEELADIGRKRFHIAPPSLRVDRVEGERGFAGAGQTGKYTKAVARYLHVHIF